MGCCCSSCCCNPDVEPSREFILSHNTSRVKPGCASGARVTPSTPSAPSAPSAPPAPSGVRNPPVSAAPAAQSYPDDEPPPYESGTVAGSSAGSSRPKDLPYIIPLTSATSPDESLAAAYVEDMQHFVKGEDYLDFLNGLDRGVFASPTAEPGSASAYIQSMFQDQGWQSSTGAIERSAAYLAEKNASLFHPAHIQVDILTTDQMKARIDAASQAQILGREDRAAVDKAELKRSKEALKLEQKLLTAKTIDKQQKAMQKFLEKDDKYTQQILKARSRSEQPAGPSGTADASSDGIYWLLVSEH